MLNKNYKKGSFWKGMVLFPVSIVLLFFIACNSDEIMNEDVTEPDIESVKKSHTEEQLFYIEEDMPSFNDGKPEIEFRKYIGENLEYPEIAVENGISGRVIIQFTVGRDGYVKDATVVRSVDPALDKEAIRVVMASPRWTPGKQRGKDVGVLFTFPINFVMNEDITLNDKHKQELNETGKVSVTKD